MTENIEDLVAWLRREFNSDMSPLGREYTDDEIATALEAEHKRAEELAAVRWTADQMAKVTAERDRLHKAITEALESTSQRAISSPDRAMDDARRILRAALAAGFRRTVQGEPSNVSESASADSSPAQVSVQGEPTDAQVDAALEAAENAGPLTPIRERLRAALRASAAVREENQ